MSLINCWEARISHEPKSYTLAQQILKLENGFLEQQILALLKEEALSDVDGVRAGCQEVLDAKSGIENLVIDIDQLIIFLSEQEQTAMEPLVQRKMKESKKRVLVDWRAEEARKRLSSILFD